MSVQLYESKFFSGIFHLIALGQFIYALYFDSVYLAPKIATTRGTLHNMMAGFGGRFRFLTYWNLIIQATYYFIALINDFIGTNEVAPKKLPFIRRVKDYVFATFAFPLAMFVGVTFWGLYGIDRELVFPKALDEFFPNWLNHVMHSNIMVFIILELFTSFRAYPKRANGFAGLAVFMVTYLIWIHVIKNFAGIWVYPVLDVMNLPQRILFFIGTIAFAFGLYIVGDFVNSQIWTREIKQAAKVSSRKGK